jgi:teichuronic acid exporter
MEELDIVTLTKRSIHGIVALTSRTFFLQLISFATFLVISSTLQARDIGIYVAVTAIQRVISFFTDFGLGAALIQKKDELTHADLKTSFTLQAGITLAIFLVILLFQQQLVQFFKLTDAGGRLLIVLVFTVFVSSFKTIPAILLERHIRFEKLIIPQIVESLTFNAILMFLVLRNVGVDSYSWAFLFSSLIGIPFYYWVSPWKIGLGIDKDSLRHLKFGAQFQAKNILATVKDDVLIAFLPLFLTLSQIGYIGFARQLAFFIYRFVVDSVTKVTFATYARIQEDATYLRKAIEKSLFFVSAIMFPILTGLMIIAPYLIRYFPKWQNKWEPAIISLLFFALNAMISALSGILITVLDAKGKVKTTLQLMVIWTILTWTLTPLLIVMYGYNGVAIGAFLVSLTIVITIRLVREFVHFSLIKSIAIPSICTVIMGVIVYSLSQLIINDLISLGFVILVGGLVYAALFVVLARKEVTSDFKRIYRRIEDEA